MLLYLRITLHTYKTRSSLQFRKFGISVKELDFMSLKTEIDGIHIEHTLVEIVVVKRSDDSELLLLRKDFFTKQFRLNLQTFKFRTLPAKIRRNLLQLGTI